MKITLATLLEGVEYTPVPGNQYEISEGNFGTLRAPTKTLTDEVAELAGTEGVSEMDLVKKILTGLKPVEVDKAYLGMAAVAVQDFFSCVTRIAEMLNARSQRADQSVATP